MSVKNIARNLFVSGALTLVGAVACSRFVSASLTTEDCRQLVEECKEDVEECRQEAEKYAKRLEECREDVEDCKYEVGEFKQEAETHARGLEECREDVKECKQEVEECKENVRKFAQEIEEYELKVVGSEWKAKEYEQLADCLRNYATCLIDSFRFSNNATEDLCVSSDNLYKCAKYLEWCTDEIKRNIKEDNAKAKAHMFL